MRKLIARLNRAHKRASLRHELRAMRTLSGPCADQRAETIMRQLDELESQDRAESIILMRRQGRVTTMPVLQRAAPAYPRRPEPFADAARQVLAIVSIALAVGSLWK